MHNTLKYNPKGRKHNVQITNSCHFHHQPLWFHLWVFLKSVYVLVRMFCFERVVLQQIQGQWFTCQLGFSLRTHMYIFKFWHEKEQYVIQFAVLSSFFVAFRVLSSSNHQVCFALSLLFDVSLCNGNYCNIIVSSWL